MYRLLLAATLVLTQALPAFAAKVTLSPRLSFSGEYTDNVNRTKENKQDDVTYIVTPGVTLNVAVPGERSGLNLSYDPGYVSYRDGEAEDNWRHYGSLNAWYALSKRTRFNFYDTLTISEDPADDTDDPTIRRGRNRYTRNTATANINHRFGAADSYNIGYSHTLLDNTEESLENSYRHHPYAGITWWFKPGRYALDLGGDFTRGEFEDSEDFDRWHGNARIRMRLTKYLDAFLDYGYSTIDYFGEKENYETHTAGLGASYVLGRYISTSFSVNYLKRDLEISEDNERLIVIWDINAQKRWALNRGSYGISGKSGYREETFGAENLGFHIFYGVNGDVGYQLTRTLSGHASVGYRNNRYLDIEPEREDSVLNAGAGLSWRPSAFVLCRLNYSYNTVFSNFEENEFTENRVYLSITLTPRKPLQLHP